MSYYDDYDDYESVVDNRSDVIDFGDVGGVGQLIYHTFRFPEYEYEYTNDDCLCLKPIGTASMENKSGLSGSDIFMKLYNLGIKINSLSEEKPYYELIIEFCKTVAHPYYIDELYETMTEKDFDYKHDGELLNKDAMFGVNDFLNDLKRFYTTAQFFFAIKEICAGGSGEMAYNLFKEGRLFDGLPFFEKYRNERYYDEHTIDRTPISSYDLLKEMRKEKRKETKSQRAHPYVENGWFPVEPCDDIDNLQRTLIDIMPDFHMRLKVNPKNKNIIFAADVNSVFDIAWYTLAWMITDYDPLENRKKNRDTDKGTLVTCLNCGEVYMRRSNRQQYCNKEECQKAHSIMRQKKYRDAKKLRETQEKNKK